MRMWKRTGVGTRRVSHPLGAVSRGGVVIVDAIHRTAKARRAP